LNPVIKVVVYREGEAPPVVGGETTADTPPTEPTDTVPEETPQAEGETEEAE